MPANTPTETNTPTPENTATETIVPTETKIPLNKLDLGSIFTDTSVLPTGYEYGQISYTVPGAFKEELKGINQVDVRISKQGEVSGGTTIMLYEDPDDANTTFEHLLKGMGEGVFVEEGENYRYAATTNYIGLEYTTAAFVQCETTVVYTLITEIRNKDSVTTYMAYILRTLKPFVCE